jgi:DNA-directed RNA polymerase subunit RPC12/RpoP
MKCPVCNSKMVKSTMAIGNYKEMVYKCPKCKKRVIEFKEKKG